MRRLGQACPILVSVKGRGRAPFAVHPADLMWSWRSGSDEVRLWCAVYGCTCTRGRVLLEGACVSGIRNTVSGIRNTGPVQVYAILWYVQYLGIHVLQYPQYCTFVSIHMYPCIHAAPNPCQPKNIVSVDKHKMRGKQSDCFPTAFPLLFYCFPTAFLCFPMLSHCFPTAFLCFPMLSHFFPMLSHCFPVLSHCFPELSSRKT